jgi:hypothetical protein
MANLEIQAQEAHCTAFLDGYHNTLCDLMIFNFNFLQFVPILVFPILRCFLLTYVKWCWKCEGKDAKFCSACKHKNLAFTPRFFTSSRTQREC